MTTTINASTSAGVVTTADTSGSLALQTASTTALTLDTSQNATFAGSVKTNTLTSAASTALTLQSGGTTAVTIDTSQNVGIGVTPSAWYSTYRALSIGYSSNGMFSGGATQLGLTQNAYLDSGLNYVYTTSNPASQYIQQSGAHTWRSAASGTAGNAITFTQLLAVEKDKSLALQGATSATGTGIAFPATQSASSDANTLDDYEEGDWTPVLGGSTSQSGQTYSIQQGKYIKIGKQVTLTFRIALSAKGTITGTYAQLKGFPFTIGGGSSTSGSISYYANMNTGFYWMGMYSDSNEVFAYVTANTGLVANVQILDPTNINNSTGLFGSITYNSV